MTCTGFIVILGDDVGWGEIGAYGQRKIARPRIDRMAAEGLMFTDAYASSPVCAPDRASLFTGPHSGHTAVRRSPPRHGTSRSGPIPRSRPCWPGSATAPACSASGASDPTRTAPTLPHAPSTIPDLGAYTDTEWSGPDRAHTAQVGLLGAYVGRVIDTATELGLADDTVIVFTSDNGPHEEKGVDPDFFAVAGLFCGYKRSLYEGGIRIPLVAWSPRLPAATAGKRSTVPIAHYDLLPTLADVAGAPVSPGLDGVSMRPALTGRGTVPERPYLHWGAGACRPHPAPARPGAQAAPRRRGGGAVSADGQIAAPEGGEAQRGEGQGEADQDGERDEGEVGARLRDVGER
ncbi:sulfatase-like hydrolase/transferase [Actinocorallia sp. A-T 12471]|uniref:sulfatase-like hydrolase/transferase n=1 Tax=Actinocorallia sp. A-T 12471 TaxID=3089813 RepID=UPI0029CB4F9F|nr:sulfatase-like hydrolase/transferase [Actinocorallia sp. A-T 12471]MDX6744443.1 sulfatase-like hydrolase/transferase [Actinocorallia sp. A-T 12471]